MNPEPAGMKKLPRLLTLTIHLQTVPSPQPSPKGRGGLNENATVADFWWPLPRASSPPPA